MKFGITVLLLTTLTTSLCQRVVAPNTLATVIQDILSPKNTGKAMQVIRSAPGNRNVAFVESGKPQQATVQSSAPRRVIVLNNEAIIPQRMFMQNSEVAMPKRVVVRKIDEFATPKRVIVRKSDEFAMPKRVIVRKSDELATPSRVILQENSGVVQQVVPQAVLPQSVLTQAVLPQAVSPQTMLTQAQPIVINQPQTVEYLTAQETCFNGNPFLPAASPISAMSPTSSLLPPAIPISRGQFLRKIPIPPPYL